MFLEAFCPEFPAYITENSTHAGSVFLDCMLSLDSDVIVDNSALHVPFYDPSLLFHKKTTFISKGNPHSDM